MANQLKTTQSVFGFILQCIGYFHFLLLIAVWAASPLTSGVITRDTRDTTEDLVLEHLAVTAAIAFSGIFFMFLGNLIQKIWNIEFYLSHLAYNTYSVPVPKQTFQEKPISAPKEPNKPSNPESDMSRYAPK